MEALRIAEPPPPPATGKPPRVRGFEKNRLEALADGIFAVALTLLVLDLKLPEDLKFSSNDDLWRHLLTLERHFAIYAISFIVIGMYWISHHLQFHFIRYTDRKLIWINLFYLLFISFVPFATDLVGDHEDLVLPVEIYGVALLCLSGFAFLHVDYMQRHPYLTSHDFSPAVAMLIKRRVLTFTVIPLSSMLLAFWSTRVALYMYACLVLAHFSTGAVDEHIHTTSAPDEG